MSQARIALYSHDAMGLGHMRRNLLIADTLRRLPIRANVLLIAGAGELNAFRLPAGVDCLTLPALRKHGNGTYAARNLRIATSELVALRAEMIRCAVESFRPDALLVDKLPRGVLGELGLALSYLRARTTTRMILGLRDVLDDPVAVRREWDRAGNEEAIRDFYDEIWVYGDPTIYDPVRECGLSADVASKVKYTGYLDPRRRLEARGAGEPLSSLNLPPGRLVLCQVGGGQDGGRLAESFAQATLPRGTNGVILTGPFMPSETRRNLEDMAARARRLTVMEFVSEPLGLLKHCERVIAMGGYNTLCEIVRLGIPALIVPRVKPRSEQLIRARRFRDLGLLDLLPPVLTTPEALTDWMSREVVRPVAAHDRIDFAGLTRIPPLLAGVLAREWPAIETGALCAARTA